MRTVCQPFEKAFFSFIYAIKIENDSESENLCDVVETRKCRCCYWCRYCCCYCVASAAAAYVLICFVVVVFLQLVYRVAKWIEFCNQSFLYLTIPPSTMETTSRTFTYLYAKNVTMQKKK